MTTVIISSTEDEASTNIKKGLLSIGDWSETDIFFNKPVYKLNTDRDVIMVTIEDRTILHEQLVQQIIAELKISPDKAIFISRHRSKSGKPTLTTHPIGNYSKASFGGKNKTLCTALPFMMSALLRIMKKYAEEENLYHDVGFEVTHHGPYMSVPTLFAEVGSTLVEWEKTRPAEVVARSILTLLSMTEEEKENLKKIPVLIGVGGGHYAPRFSTVVFQKKVAFGHMIPSYHIKPGHIDRDMLKKAIDATPHASGVYLDRKALSKATRDQFQQWCEDLDIPLVSSNDFTDL